MSERRERRKRDPVLIACATLGLVSAIVVGLVVSPVLLRTARLAEDNARLNHRIAVESRERRDQTCNSLERQEQQEIRRVLRTYDYLGSLPREEYGSSLTVAVVRGLSDQEKGARASAAPPFCNARGVGLPELSSDPRLPRHRTFARLLQKP